MFTAQLPAQSSLGSTLANNEHRVWRGRDLQYASYQPYHLVPRRCIGQCGEGVLTDSGGQARFCQFVARNVSQAGLTDCSQFQKEDLIVTGSFEYQRRHSVFIGQWKQLVTTADQQRAEQSPQIQI